MGKEVYDNVLRKQCMSIPSLAALQVQGVRKGIREGIPDEMLKGIRKVIVTGCGDSYAASLVSIPVFRIFAGKFGSEFTYMRAIDAARFLSFEKFDPASTLIVGVSCSGGPARIQEVLRRANRYGCNSLAVTNNPESNAAKEAKYVLLTYTPDFPVVGPGLRNYFASMTGLFLLAAHMGEIKNCCTQEMTDELSEAIISNAEHWQTALPEIDTQMFDIAQRWKSFRAFDCIGDDAAYATAFFVGAKIVETSGCHVHADDSEDWCHVGFYQKNPRAIGTIVQGNKRAHDFGRLEETLSQAAGIYRPILFISNAYKDELKINNEINICTIPDVQKGYDFLLPMTDYIPGAILAGYLAALNNEPYFRGGGIWSRPGNNTIRTSKIDVV